MKINSIDSKGSFVIKNETTDLLTVIYEKWFSSKAKTNLNGVELIIKPKNIWHSKFDILKNGVDKGDIVITWKGSIAITLKDIIGDNKEWIIKIKGFWAYRFEVFSNTNKLILVLKPNFNWKNFKYNYEVKILEENLTKNEILELITYASYGVNLYQTQHAGMG